MTIRNWRDWSNRTDEKILKTLPTVLMKIENDLCLNGLFSCIYTKMDLLDGYQKRNLSFEKLIGKKHRAFCRAKRKLTVDNYWRKVNFPDESKFVVGQDSLVYIWRKRGEDWSPDLVEARRTKPPYEVMVL